MNHSKQEVEKILLSKRDCANALSLSVRTVENLIARKELIARRVGRRTLVLASSLQAFARRDHASPSQPKPVGTPRDETTELHV